MSLDIGMGCNWVCYREHARWNLVQAGLLRSEMSDTVGFGGCVVRAVCSGGCENGPRDGFQET